MKVDAIHIYPIKSIAGISLDSSQVTLSGLFNDRRYMLVQPNGNFVTARKYPVLTQIHGHFNDQGELLLNYQGQNITLNTNRFSHEYKTVKIWGTSVQAQICGQEYNAWFSQILGKEVELVYFAEQSERVTSKRPDQPVAFADGYPFLIASNASLDALASRCQEKVSHAHFRANIIIEGCEAFAEDSWEKFKIGDVIFESVKPCVRCSLTTVDPKTGLVNKQGEPFKTLTQFRFLKENGKNKGPTFGMNLVALNKGEIKIGDKVEVLSYRTAEKYEENA